MPQTHRRKSNNNSRKGRAAQNSRAVRTMRLIQPTYPNEYGNVALVPSDFDARVQRTLAPYGTTGKNQVFFWRAVYDVSIGSQVALADATGAVLFKLSSMPGYADLAAVFDTYRLRAVSVSIMPSNGVMTVSGSAVAPRLWTVIDYDDATSLARSALEQYDTVTVSPPGNGVVRTLCPRFAVSAYGGGAFTNYAQSDPDQWIDIASPSVEYYGVKYAIESGVMGQTILQMYSCSVTAFWEFRSSK